MHKHLPSVILIFIFGLLSVFNNKLCAQENYFTIQDIITDQNQDSNTINAQVLLDSSENYWYTFPDSSIFLTEQAIKCFDTIKHKKIISRAYSSFGTSYYIKGDYSQSLGYYFMALNLNTILRDSIKIAITQNNIGNIHMVQGKFNEAHKLFKSALYIKKLLKDTVSIGHTLLSISNLYSLEGHYNDALKYANLALDKFTFNKDFNNMVPIYTSLGSISYNLNKPDEALKYFDSALVISKQTKDNQNECIISLNIGNVHINNDNISIGIAYYENALFLAQEIDYLQGLSKSFEKLHSSYELLNMHEEALLYHKLFIDMRDSLMRNDNIEALIKNNLEYEFAKERELSILKQDKKDIVIKQKEKRKNFIIIIFMLSFFVLVVIFLIVYKSNADKKKSNQQLEIKNKLINSQLKEIKDSIVYAKRIQDAVLPTYSTIKKHLKDSFVLYLPKDIVAGDFYWIEKCDDELLFAVADCTGHGVPGALVSVICNNGLNASVREHKITDPGTILDMTRDIVIESFEKSNEFKISRNELKDGMDIAICSIKGKELKYAGANNPLWLIRNGKIHVTIADRQPIGKFKDNKRFNTKHVNLQKGDAIYLFTDGYIDQFGGGKNKKYKTSNFKRFLLSIQDQSMEDQRILLEEEFNKWKGSLSQIDDVCIMGVKFQ